jgi:hypothetical protein
MKKCECDKLVPDIHYLDNDHQCEKCGNHTIYPQSAICCNKHSQAI